MPRLLGFGKIWKIPSFFVSFYTASLINTHVLVTNSFLFSNRLGLSLISIVIVAKMNMTTDEPVNSFLSWYFISSKTQLEKGAGVSIRVARPSPNLCSSYWMWSLDKFMSVMMSTEGGSTTSTLSPLVSF